MRFGLAGAVGCSRTSSPARSGAGSAASPSSPDCKPPCRRLSVSGTVRSGVLRAALACLAPWGCVRGWRCSGRWHGAGRQQERRRRRRCDPNLLSQVCLSKWAWRDAAAGARPADRPGAAVSPFLSHAADAAVLRRPCAAPHCVSAWGDVLQWASRKQVHRHDRELDRQHLQALRTVSPPAGAVGEPQRAIRRTTRSIGVLGAVGLRAWMVRCSGRWHGAGRQQQQRRGGYSGAPWRTAVATLGTAAAPSAAVPRGYCGSTHPMRGSTGGKRAARPRAWWMLCALRGARPCGACTEGHSAVVWVLGRPRSMMRRHTRLSLPIRTARRTPSRPSTRRSPSHRRPMGRGRGLRSAIARGGSCAAGGAGAGRCDPSRLSQGCLCK
jgi:hypothetical protein